MLRTVDDSKVPNNDSYCLLPSPLGEDNPVDPVDDSKVLNNDSYCLLPGPLEENDPVVPSTSPELLVVLIPPITTALRQAPLGTLSEHPA